MERVAVYARGFADEEMALAAETAGEWVAQRMRPNRARVRAKLLSLPTGGAETDGTQVGVSLWEVERVVTGTLEMRQIAVQRYLKLNGLPVPGVGVAVGEVAELTLEPTEDHPELAGVAEVAAAGTEGVLRFVMPLPARAMVR